MTKLPGDGGGGIEERGIADAQTNDHRGENAGSCSRDEIGEPG
jgi:hypothetical protein